MSVHKDEKTGKWYYTGKYRDLMGNRHDYKKRGFKTDIGNDEHNYYETVWYIRAYNNKRAYDNRNNTETSKSLDSNGKKKEKKKSRIIVKIIRDSYGNVTRVFVEPKAKKKKEVVEMAAAAYQSLLAME